MIVILTIPGHHSQRSVSLSNRVRLHITVVVLAGPDEAALALHGLGDHVVYQTVLVPGRDTGFECIKSFTVVGDMYNL